MPDYAIYTSTANDRSITGSSFTEAGSFGAIGCAQRSHLPMADEGAVFEYEVLEWNRFDQRSLTLATPSGLAPFARLQPEIMLLVWPTTTR